jgi:hypothetical protein
MEVASGQVTHRAIHVFGKWPINGLLVQVRRPSVEVGGQLSPSADLTSEFSTQSTALGSTCTGIFSVIMRNKMVIKAVITRLTTPYAA